MEVCLTTVSIVVPAHNEEALLPRCLDALLGQDYAGPIEVIVVDSGSTDRTAELAGRPGVTVLREPLPGYRTALTRGFEAARGEIIACTDADSEVPRHWVSRLVQEYQDHPDVVSVGGAIDFNGANWKGGLISRVILPVINRVDRSGPRGPHLWGANFSVRREAFLRSGGFNQDFELQADTEISERLRDYGRVVLLEDLPVRSSSRRWNHALLSSMFLFGTNFVWFKLFRRPLYRSFPAVRDHLPERRPLPRPWFATMGLLLFAGALWLALTPESNVFGKTVSHVATTRRVVALTFDDGPNDPCTSQVLDILEREGVRATFFLIGENVRHYPQTAARAVHDGDVVGNHSDRHPDAFALESTTKQQAELDRAEQSIYAATGRYPRLFRPPHGLRSPWLMRTLASDSMVAVTWNDAAGDWDPMPPSRIAALTIERARPGSIVLLHDGMNLEHGADQGQTVQALPEIIHGLRARGFSFVTVPELLNQPAYLRTWGTGTEQPSALR